MTKGLNITLTDEDVLPIDVLIFKGIRIGAFHDANTNVTTISSIYDGTTEQQINDNFATWKQEYLNYQPTATVIKNRRAEYPVIEDQLDMQYWDQVNGTTTWKDAIAKVKTDNPKE
tara:strand:+ start:471 stop:818 length:348 start_codon:yes stop_codon:yes gene_type:complete